jgi:AMP-binding enzyme
VVAAVRRRGAHSCRALSRRLITKRHQAVKQSQTQRMSQNPQRLRVSNPSAPFPRSARYERHLSQYFRRARNAQDFFHIRREVLLGDATVILRERFEPAEVLEAVEAERATHPALVEPLLVELVDHPDFVRRDLSSLRSISHIGANAAPSSRRRLLRRAGPVLSNPYGASEAGIVSVLTAPDYSLDHPRATGHGRDAAAPGLTFGSSEPTPARRPRERKD